jgi:hypothetical protein
MSSSTPTHDAIAECHEVGTPESRLLALLRDNRSIVRSNALLALASRQPVDEPAVLAALLHVVSAAEVSAKPLIGTMTERMMAAYALHGIGTPLSCTALREVENLLTKTELEDLHWNFLNNPVQRRNAPSLDSPPS